MSVSHRYLPCSTHDEQAHRLVGTLFRVFNLFGGEQLRLCLQVAEVMLELVVIDVLAYPSEGIKKDGDVGVKNDFRPVVLVIIAPCDFRLGRDGACGY